MTEWAGVPGQRSLRAAGVCAVVYRLANGRMVLCGEQQDTPHDHDCPPDDRPRGFIYDGSFDLTILREGETVGSAGDGSGSCWVEEVTGPGKARGFRVDIGQVVERLPGVGLVSYTPD